MHDPEFFESEYDNQPALELNYDVMTVPNLISLDHLSSIRSVRCEPSALEVRIVYLDLTCAYTKRQYYPAWDITLCGWFCRLSNFLELQIELYDSEQAVDWQDKLVVGGLKWECIINPEEDTFQAFYRLVHDVIRIDAKRVRLVTEEK